MSFTPNVSTYYTTPTTVTYYFYAYSQDWSQYILKTFTVTVNPAKYTLSVSPVSASITEGQTTYTYLYVNQYRTTTGYVEVSGSDGYTAARTAYSPGSYYLQFTPTIPKDATSQQTVTYTFKLYKDATSTTPEKTATFTVYVTPVSFSLSLDPATRTIEQGNTATTTMSVSKDKTKGTGAYIYVYGSDGYSTGSYQWYAKGDYPMSFTPNVSTYYTTPTTVTYYFYAYSQDWSQYILKTFTVTVNPHYTVAVDPASITVKSGKSVNVKVTVNTPYVKVSPPGSLYYVGYYGGSTYVTLAPTRTTLYSFTACLDTGDETDAIAYVYVEIK